MGKSKTESVAPPSKKEIGVTSSKIKKPSTNTRRSATKSKWDCWKRKVLNALGSRDQKIKELWEIAQLTNVLNNKDPTDAEKNLIRQIQKGLKQYCSANEYPENLFIKNEDEEEMDEPNQEVSETIEEKSNVSPPIVNVNVTPSPSVVKKSPETKSKPEETEEDEESSPPISRQKSEIKKKKKAEETVIKIRSLAKEPRQMEDSDGSYHEE